MKRIYVLLIAIVFSALSCSEIETASEMPLSDPADHNMKIIPENPTSVDEIKLVVYDDCNYNVLSGVTRNDKIIEIRKQFNSMMKLPCMLTNDTISIGKLPEGTYTMKYKLVDLSTFVKDPIAMSFAYSLKVSH